MEDFDQKHTLEQIELGMLKRAQEVWQSKNLPLEAFDPVVKMLIGACAVEVKKVFDEIQDSRSRVMQNLAQAMMQDVLTGAIPASCIMQIQPVEPQLEITPELHVGCVKEGTEVVFSPAGHYQSIDARVEASLLLLTDSLIDITERAVPTKKKAQSKFVDLINREDFEISHERALLIGLDVNEEITDLDGLSFFFDWMNVPARQRMEYCKLLQATHWKLNGKDIQTVTGLSQKRDFDELEDLQELKNEFDISKMLEDQINAYYKHHFVTLKVSDEDRSLIQAKQTCPDSIKHLFDKQSPPFNKPLVWLEVFLPASFPNIALAEQLSHCLINCIPVMNRKLNVKHHMLFDQNLNVIPLKTDDQFLAIEAVSDNSGNVYQSVQNIFDSQNNTGMYLLRRGGVGRIDSRRAKELLSQLVNTVYDESLAFSALYPDELITDLNTLKKILARIDKKLSQLESPSESPGYIVLNPARKYEGMYEDIEVEYWTTNGSFGNDIPPGEINKVSSINFAPAIREITNVTMSISGRDSLKEADLLNVYRQQILTRGRIVTAGDLRAVCFSYLGTNIIDVEISKKYMIDKSPKNGFIRVMEIVLVPSATCKFSAKDWEQISHDLEISLEEQWTGTIPLHIQTKNS